MHSYVTLRCAPPPTPLPRAQLRKLIPDVTTCPPKRIWASQTHEFLEQRRGELLGWLQTVRVRGFGVASRALPTR